MSFALLTIILVWTQFSYGAVSSQFIDNAKKHYQSEQWDRFFSFARYHRKNFSPAELNRSLLGLEILALIKHCQYEAAENLTYFGEKLGMDTRSFRALLSLQQNYPSVINVVEKKLRSTVFSKAQLWKIPKIEKSQMTHLGPDQMRIFVQNLCSKTESKKNETSPNESKGNLAAALLSFSKKMNAQMESQAISAFEEACDPKLEASKNCLLGAEILSFVHDSKLKKRKRFDYALLVYSNLKEKTSKYYALSRFLGDSYFERNKLKEAKQIYEKLVESPDLDEQQYARYKRAWILLNEEDREGAFVELQKAQATPVQTLRPLILKDLGRVVAEIFQSGVAPGALLQKQLIVSTQFDSREEAIFIEGIHLGLKRFTDPKAFEAFYLFSEQAPWGATLFKCAFFKEMKIPQLLLASTFQNRQFEKHRVILKTFFPLEQIYKLSKFEITQWIASLLEIKDEPSALLILSNRQSSSKEMKPLLLDLAVAYNQLEVATELLKSTKLSQAPKHWDDFNELKKIEDLKNKISILDLKLNSKFSKNLGSAIQQLQARLKQSGSRHWNAVIWRDTSKKLLAETCSLLSSKIKVFAEENSPQPEFKKSMFDLSAAVESWALRLL